MFILTPMLEVADRYRDDLTGALNRRYLREALPRVFEELRGLGLPLSMLVLDLDNFKAINDTFGHLEGDAVLQELVQFLRSRLRQSDLIIRYGGDEFILVLTHTDQDTAWKVANRLLEELRKTPLHGHQISGSIGVATFPVDGWSLNDLFARADEALYRAKNLGRNRVESTHTRTPTLEWPVAFIPRIREERALEQAFQNHPGLVLITGPAGIGKTRMLTEFLVSRKITFLRGNAYALFQGMAYAPFVEMIQAALQQEPALLEGLPSPYREDIQALLHRSGGEPASRTRLFEAIYRFLEQAPAEVLMLDDLQWLDESSQELLYFLLRSGLRFVGTLRKEEQERVALAFLHALHREGRVEEIPVPPLSWEQVRVLLHRALQMEPDAALVDTLYRFSGGNPYLVGEVLSDLYRRGYLRFRSVWELRLPPAYDPPRSVEALLIYKLGLLSPEHIRLLEAAAVLGPTFDPKSLAELVGKDVTDLLDLLEDLVRAQLLREDGETFSFQEDVIREAVLARMSALRRRPLHARAARLAERSQAPSEVMAFHLHHAGEKEKAFQALLRAIDEAMRVYAYPTALRLSEMALEDATSPEARRQVLLRRGKIFRFLGEYDHAEACFQELLQNPEDLGELLGEVAVNWLNLLVARGRYREALREAEQFLQKVALPLYRVQIQLEMIWAQIQLGEYAKARPSLRKLEKEAEALEGEVLAKLYNLRAHVEEKQERWKRAEQDYNRALKHYQNLGDRRGEGVVLANIASLYLAQYHLEKALEYYRRALAVYENIGYLGGKVITLGNLGVVYNNLGYVGAAIQALQEAVLLANRMGYRRILPIFYGHLARAYAYKGEKERALGFLELSLEQARSQDQQESVFLRTLEKAYLHLLFGDPVSAREILRSLNRDLSPSQHRRQFWWALILLEVDLTEGRTDALFERMQMVEEALKHLRGRSLRLYAALARAKVLAVLGKGEEALEALKRARNLLRQLKIPLTRGEFYLDQGKVYQALGDRARALQSFHQAEKIFHDLGVELLREEALARMAALEAATSR